MPGPSPTPGSAGDAKTEWVILPAAGRSGPVPKLPTRRPVWCKATREWWAWLWATPQATRWAEGDQTLLRLAGLVDLVNVGQGTAALLAEIRQLEDRYGLSPKALVQLRWRIADVPVAPSRSASEAKAADELEAKRRERAEAAAG